MCWRTLGALRPQRLEAFIAVGIFRFGISISLFPLSIVALGGVTAQAPPQCRCKRYGAVRYGAGRVITSRSSAWLSRTAFSTTPRWAAGTSASELSAA